MESKKNFKFIYVLIIIIISVIAVLFGFISFSNIKPSNIYRVYIDGKFIGNVKDKNEFDSYINSKNNYIKSKLGVDNVYIPNGVKIKKVTTYFNNYDSYDEIYKKIIDLKQFTIKGTIISIKDSGNSRSSESSEGNETTDDNKENSLVFNASENTLDSKKDNNDNKYKYVYVIDKGIFDEAVDKLILSFVDEKQYNDYMNGSQEKIVDTGRIIQDVDLFEDISYKKGYISIDEEIFTNASDLAMYLLYGSTSEQSKYVVREGDTIASVAEANKLNTQEFLLANPTFKNENTLLYEGEEVNVGLINPIVNVVVEYNGINDEERSFNTNVEYDDSELANVEYVYQEGENGLYRVNRKYQYISGQLVSTITLGSEELKASVDKIIIKGSKEVPYVADLSNWAWPTEQPYSISTYYGYRWGSMHPAIDITGPGYGSNIYAANNGTVVEVKGGCVPGNIGCNGRRGNFVVVNHNNANYYSVYMHLNSISVKVGDTVGRGQKIGTMGNSGEVYPIPSAGCAYCGTHLHFEIRVGRPYSGGYSTTLNPLDLY